jgi:hypothetical protein
MIHAHPSGYDYYLDCQNAGLVERQNSYPSSSDVQHPAPSDALGKFLNSYK